MQAPYDLESQQEIFKLSSLIKDRSNDHVFMEKYNELKEREKETAIPSIEESSRKTEFDRIPLSSCVKVADESEIPGNFTSVTGEYLVPSENKTGFYKLNCSFDNNPDLRELLASLILKSIDVPVADIILVHDDRRNEDGCISMNILQEGERFLDADYYSYLNMPSLPDDISGLDRFIAMDLYTYQAQYNFPPEVLEQRRKFLIEYAFISAFLGNDDIKTANCQVIFNEKTGTIRNPEYYDMGMAFEGPTISPDAEYPRYFFGNQLDTDVLKELYEKYPNEVEEISKKIESSLDKNYIKTILENKVFDDLSEETRSRIWAHLGNKISYISRQNEILYGIIHNSGSFITSLDEIEEVARESKIPLLDKAKQFLQTLKQKMLGER